MPTVPLLVRRGRDGGGGGGHDSSTSPTALGATMAEGARPQWPDTRVHWSKGLSVKCHSLWEGATLASGQGARLPPGWGSRGGNAGGKGAGRSGVYENVVTHTREQWAAGANETRAQTVAVGNAKCVRRAPSRCVVLFAHRAFAAFESKNELSNKCREMFIWYDHRFLYHYVKKKMG